MKKYIVLYIFLALSLPSPLTAQDTIQKSGVQKFLGRLTVGGYGEVALTRSFYSDNVYRYSQPDAHRGEQHGRFDIPHAVIYLGYDFGKGWSMQTEVEFEHLGTGSAVEREFEEAGEWEAEIEQGGEVELEQFWIQKSIFPELNIRAGHMVVPVGGLNNAHEPLNFFTVYRPEGEFTILPSTWHDTGISIWGKVPLGKKGASMRYEAQVLAGLDAMMFSRDKFIHNGAHSAFEFKVANNYGGALRLDFLPVEGLRLGVSGFAGNTVNNTYPREKLSEQYNVKGTLLVGCFDFEYKGHGVIARGNADYGHLDDAATVSKLKARRSGGDSPYSSSPVATAAAAAGVEAGLDIFHFIPKLREKQRFYLFGRYEYYNSYIPSAGDAGGFDFTSRHRIAAGVNYFPIPQIAVKAEYSRRFLRSEFNPEPSFSIGIAYMAFFNRK